jgi:hypothetical protein
MWASKLCEPILFVSRFAPFHCFELHIRLQKLSCSISVLRRCSCAPVCVTLGGGRVGLMDCNDARCLRHVNPSKHTAHCMYIITLCILPTQCIYVFHVVLTINRDCFPKHRKVTCLRNGDAVCFLCCRNWFFYMLFFFLPRCSHTWERAPISEHRADYSVS